jgi:hypothetical protein
MAGCRHWHAFISSLLRGRHLEAADFGSQSEESGCEVAFITQVGCLHSSRACLLLFPAFQQGRRMSSCLPGRGACAAAPNRSGRCTLGDRPCTGLATHGRHQKHHTLCGQGVHVQSKRMAQSLALTLKRLTPTCQACTSVEVHLSAHSCVLHGFLHAASL